MANAVIRDYADFYNWFKSYEPSLAPDDSTFAPYADAYDLADEWCDSLQQYFSAKMYRLLVYNLSAHFIVTRLYEYTDENGETATNPLYSKYNIGEASKGLVSSASDESSSASLHITEAMQQLDYFAMDLIASPYGKFAYAMLSQVQNIVVRL